MKKKKKESGHEAGIRFLGGVRAVQHRLPHLSYLKKKTYLNSRQQEEREREGLGEWRPATVGKSLSTINSNRLRRGNNNQPIVIMMGSSMWKRALTARVDSFHQHIIIFSSFFLYPPPPPSSFLILFYIPRYIPFYLMCVCCFLGIFYSFPFI